MRRASKYLLIDISNSFAKLAFASSARTGRSQRIATEKFNSTFLRDIIKRGLSADSQGRSRRLANKIDIIVVASVVPRKNREVRKAAGKSKLLWLGPQLKLGVGIDYPKPQSIGADRLANAAAVAELYGWPAIVVDFGTAVTFDVVSEGCRYIGGVIAPGLEAVTSFLYQRTALLPKLSLKEPHRAVGKSTVEAMRSGAIFGYRGLVREILARIKAEQFSRKKVVVVATVGYARVIARGVPEITVMRPYLTLEGLR